MDALKGILCGFTQAEILKMENLFEQVGEISWDQEFCQKIAASFNCSISRDGKPAISWEQVQSWFQNRQKQLPASDTSIPVVSKELALLSEFPISSIAPESSTVNKALEWAFLCGWGRMGGSAEGEDLLQVNFRGFGKNRNGRALLCAAVFSILRTLVNRKKCKNFQKLINLLTTFVGWSDFPYLFVGALLGFLQGSFAV
ncbi:uncharacterized protein LOC131163938 isoform X4 [Malania oleifera]|uniref:uncharacterized protein LOC131163938 isoform X4 n=1 Tax=Malania oleifera TaxID=397392 RepID=UPI0025ADDC79|nr:uncharacterized protein LOC131163938 isoform X4 [Malania oleifera]